MRAIVVVQAGDQAAANALIASSYDPVGGASTFTASLEPVGGGATVAYWAALAIGSGDLNYIQTLADSIPKSDIWIWLDQPRGLIQDLNDRFGGAEYKDPNRETRSKARVHISASRAGTSVVLNQLGYEVPDSGA